MNHPDDSYWYADGWESTDGTEVTDTSVLMVDDIRSGRVKMKDPERHQLMVEYLNVTGWHSLHLVKTPPDCSKCGKMCKGGYNCAIVDGVESDILCFGCARELRLERYLVDGVLNSRLTQDAMIDKYSTTARSAHPEYADICSMTEALGAMVKAFERCWAAGFGAEYLASDMRGAGCMVPDSNLDVSVYALAGRVMVQFEDTENKSLISMITSDKSPPDIERMGLSASDGTFMQLISLLDRAIRLTKVNRIKLVEDKRVRLG